MFRLEEKVAIVTGGGRGIGEAICLALGSHGADVVVADVRSDLASRVAAKVEAMGRQALGITVDVSRPEEVRAMVRQAVERFGAVDILVNNAGILQDTFITDISEDDWDKVLGVNLKGAFLCCREVLPVMMRQGKGKIINIASTGGKQGFPLAGVHYCASKAGLMGMTRQLSMQVAGFGINVNAVAPGTTETPLIASRSDEQKRALISRIPLGRLGKPEDTASAVVFLASSAADYIHGETIDVNGGLYMD